MSIISCTLLLSHVIHYPQKFLYHASFELMTVITADIHYFAVVLVSSYLGESADYVTLFIKYTRLSVLISMIRLY